MNNDSKVPKVDSEPEPVPIPEDNLSKQDEEEEDPVVQNMTEREREAMRAAVYNPLVLQLVFHNLELHDAKIARHVCSLWEILASKCVRNLARVHFKLGVPASSNNTNYDAATTETRSDDAAVAAAPTAAAQDANNVVAAVANIVADDDEDEDEKTELSPEAYVNLTNFVTYMKEHPERKNLCKTYKIRCHEDATQLTVDFFRTCGEAMEKLTLNTFKILHLDHVLELLQAHFPNLQQLTLKDCFCDHTLTETEDEFNERKFSPTIMPFNGGVLLPNLHTLKVSNIEYRSDLYSLSITMNWEVLLQSCPNLRTVIFWYMSVQEAFTFLDAIARIGVLVEPRAGCLDLTELSLSTHHGRYEILPNISEIEQIFVLYLQRALLKLPKLENLEFAMFPRYFQHFQRTLGHLPHLKILRLDNTPSTCCFCNPPPDGGYNTVALTREFPTITELQIPFNYLGNFDHLATLFPSLQKLFLFVSNYCEYECEASEGGKLALNFTGNLKLFLSSSIPSRPHLKVTSFTFIYDIPDDVQTEHNLSLDKGFFIYIARLFPNLTQLSTNVSSGKQLAHIFAHFGNKLKILTIGPHSTYKTLDEDIIGMKEGLENGKGGQAAENKLPSDDFKCGIKNMKELVSLQLRNDNGALTSASFVGGFELCPRLKTVALNHCPNINQDDLDRIRQVGTMTLLIRSANLK